MAPGSGLGVNMPIHFCQAGIVLEQNEVIKHQTRILAFDLRCQPKFFNSLRSV